MIKYIDLGISAEEYKNEISPRLKEIFLTGSFISDSIVENFENNFSSYCGAKYSIALNSGTDALIFALNSLDIGHGDEVITVSNSFIATANAIVHVGATPIFVDIDDNLLIDHTKIEAAITKRTKAIMPVQLMGMVSNMSEINKIAKKYNLYIIEDAAQSVGSKFKERKTGILADISCFSLHPLKNLSGITDGGIITTNNKQVVDYIKQIRNHGLFNRDEQSMIGRVSRLNSINAVILDYRLTKLDGIIEERRKAADIYSSLLSNVEKVSLITVPVNIFHTYHTYVIKVNDRSKLQTYLQNKGIETKIHYPIPIHEQKPFKSNKCDLENTKKLSNKILTLPIANITQTEITYVCNAIAQFYKEN